MTELAAYAQARHRTEAKMEKMMEEELVRNAVKIQSVARGRQGRKQAENKMEELMETMANERLRKANHAEMIVEELLAGRLYSGARRSRV